MTRSHFAINRGTFFLICSRYQRSSTSCFFASLAPGRTFKTNTECFSSTLGAASFHHSQQVTLSPNIMTLTIQIFALRLALLLPQLPLLFPDPPQLGNCKYSNRINTYSTSR